MQLDANPATRRSVGRPKKTVVVACPTCGQDFETIPSEIARGSGIYCGRKCYGEAKRAEALARFWDRLVANASDCREWPGVRLPSGYGQITVGRRMHLTHRLSWELSYGPIPRGMSVCHTCDNPPCCNPEHLFLGFAVDNAADKVRKGRQPRGEAIRQSRLTADAVRAIRDALAAGMRRSDLARQYGVASDTISMIARGHTWQHIV